MDKVNLEIVVYSL